MFIAGESLTLLWNHAPYRYDYPASLINQCLSSLIQVAKFSERPLYCPQNEKIEVKSLLLTKQYSKAEEREIFMGKNWGKTVAVYKPYNGCSLRKID